MRIDRLRQLREAGDTIVEVFIAMTVISVVLGGAYVITTKNARATREAQERVQAQKLVESQIEQLKNVAETNSTAIFGSSVPATYCISGAGTVVPSTDAACSVNSAGMPTTVEPIYKLSISRTTNTFTIRNTWESLTKDVPNVVEMTYRVYD